MNDSNIPRNDNTINENHSIEKNKPVKTHDSYIINTPLDCFSDSGDKEKSHNANSGEMHVVNFPIQFMNEL